MINRSLPIAKSLNARDISGGNDKNGWLFNSVIPFLRICIALLIFVGVSISILDIIDQIYPLSGHWPFVEFARRHFYDDEFVAHFQELRAYPIQRLIHAFFGIGYLLIAPLQFVPSLRNNFPYLHRTIGWAIVITSLILNLGGLVIVVNASYVGLGEQIAMFVFVFLYIPIIYMALKNIRVGNVAKHREWMILAFAMMLAIIAVRVWFMVFKTTGYPSSQFFVVIMWLAVGINMTIASAWIMLSRQSATWAQ